MLNEGSVDSLNFDSVLKNSGSVIIWSGTPRDLQLIIHIACNGSDYLVRFISHAHKVHSREIAPAMSVLGTVPEKVYFTFGLSIYYDLSG